MAKLYYKKKCTKSVARAEETKDQTKIELKAKKLSHLESSSQADQIENNQNLSAIEAKVKAIDASKDETPEHDENIKNLGLSNNKMVELATNKQQVIDTSKEKLQSDKEQDPKANKLIKTS